MERCDGDPHGVAMIRIRYGFCRVRAGDHVLDVGCGRGYGARSLAARGALVTGVDVAPDVIRDNLARGDSGVSYHVASASDLQIFADESFDTVTCMEVLEHVQDFRRAVAEMYRVLRPDGTLYLSTPNADRTDGGNPFHLRVCPPRVGRPAVAVL